ncbi:MAG TPA: glucose-6-phosphate dehydrogenase [Candidatus Paceibacterota bacterium]
MKETANVPTIFIIFGITGDLAQRKLLPALLSLYTKKALPARFSIVGVSRRQFSREEFREYVRQEMNVEPHQYKGEDIKHFLDHIRYEQALFDDKNSYIRLADTLESIDAQWKICSNKLFHLSVPPSFYELILKNLSVSGLTIPCGGNEGWTRVLVEKPFGNDMSTAESLDALLGSLFKEEQIFRIDHYLAKESVQNILAFRFANAMFEPLWSSEFIERVEIKLLEKLGMEGRGNFYDSVGAIKDVGQNHILQMLTLIAMERPSKMTANHIRGERTKVLRSLALIEKRNIKHNVIRAQYDGYVSEPGVKKESRTETYFKIRTFINNERWEKVPFYLEAGKGLKEQEVLIRIHFKNDKAPDQKNVLTFSIQPNEGIDILFWVKTPGSGAEVEPKTLSFKYKDFPSTATIPDAYERVLLDAIMGDQTLFASTEEVKWAWKFITPVINALHTVPLYVYQKGSSVFDN